MADDVQKRSNWVGSKNTDLEKYTVDLDADIFNLFQEKSLNLEEAKRYSYMVAAHAS